MSFVSCLENVVVGDRFMADSRWFLWIDSVGVFLICTGDRVTVGRTVIDGEEADIALLANLSRRHVTIVRSHGGYVLEAHAPTKVAGRPVHDRIHLNDGSEIEFGAGVRFLFRLPTALSATARLEFVSDHRPPRSTDAVILMDETCLIGAGRDKHVECPEWRESILVFRRGNQWWCKSPMSLFVDDRPVGEETRLNAGDIVTGSELRFWLEDGGTSVAGAS